jgi:hypothetical protein
VQDNLFDALQADVPESAELCIEIAEDISNRRLLSYRELVHLSQAYVTLSDWPGLLKLADRAIQQYGHLPRTVAIKAVALDGSGDAAGAMRILAELIAEHPDEDLAVRSYVNICIRTGFHENAVLQLESLFNSATDRAQQLVYLRQLFSLRYSLSPDDPNLVDLAWRYGQIADTAVEEEEGIFLQLFIAATHNVSVTVDQDRVRDFKNRADSFFANWPESSIIRRFELPGRAESGEFLSALEQAVGITAEGREWFKAMEAQLSRGELVTPYCWRPRRLLRNVANVPHMWHITQNSNKDAREYHFSISTDIGAERLDLSRDVPNPPLIDLTTLLVLYDLGVLKYIFSVFRKIAVPVETILEVQNLAHPFIGGYRTVVGIRDFLRANVDRVLQPSGSLTDKNSAEEPLDRGLEEIKELTSSGRYSLYLDDSVARQYANGDVSDVTLITTLDLLEEFERREILTAAEVAEKLALLTRWNVGVVIRERYFFSAIPASIGAARDIESLIDVLMEEGAFRDLVDGVWDFRRDYRATLTHLAAILADVARSAQASADLVAAIWAVWQIKSNTRGLDVDPMHHRATVFVRTAVAAKGDVNAVKKLWDAYVTLVERQFGDRMDEKADMQSRQLVGEVAAEIVQQSESPTIGDELLELLLSPYESGISERDWVNDSYVQKRLELERDQDKSD